MPPLVLALALAGATVAHQGPCDITGEALNPCVAAHSTTRALYAKYDGPLYNVTRSSDGASTNVGVLTPGGFADTAKHDAFCVAGDCVISNVFDQSPMGNHLGPVNHTYRSKWQHLDSRVCKAPGTDRSRCCGSQPKHVPNPAYR